MGCDILLSFSHGQEMRVAQPSLECTQHIQHSPGMGVLSLCIITPQGTVVSCPGSIHSAPET